MAVITTPRIILDGAYAKSQKNTPGVIATESVELLQLVIRALRGIYAFAARINPTFYAESAVVAYANPGWKRPETAEAIFRIELPAGGEVVVTPFDDRLAEAGLASVYPLGQIYRPAGAAAPHPQAGNLTFFYSKRPTDPANLDATLDALWTEQFNELLILEVAIYLAIKDGRGDELGAYRDDRDRWARLFAAFLEHETMNMRRRYGQIGRFNSATKVPLMSLLAGNSAAIA